jgi:hypothetical protein
MAWLLEWAKAFGLSALALVVSISAVFVSILIARWQLSIARAKLQHDLYDRRFAIYMAFHELLVAIVEKDDVEAELRKANAIRAHSPFLLDAQLGAYLERLHNEAFRINARAKLVKNQSFGSPPIVPNKPLSLGKISWPSLIASTNWQENLSVFSGCRLHRRISPIMESDFK